MLGFRRVRAILVLGAAGCALPVCAAAETLPVVRGPASLTRLVPEQAAVLEFTVQLTDSDTLASELRLLGVEEADVSKAASLTKAQLGQNAKDCSAKVAISRDVASRTFRLKRVTLLTATAQTIIDRRNGKLVALPTTKRPSATSRIA